MKTLKSLIILLLLFGLIWLGYYFSWYDKTTTVAITISTIFIGVLGDWYIRKQNKSKNE